MGTLDSETHLIHLIYLNVQIVFIDGPHVLQPIDLPSPSKMGYFIGFDSQPPKNEPQRGWWKNQNPGGISAELEVTLMLLKDVLKEKGKFDVRRLLSCQLWGYCCTWVGIELYSGSARIQV